MLGNVIGLVILVALIVLFLWLAARAWRSRRAIIKWPGVIFSGLLALLLIAVTAVIGIGLYKLYAPRNIPVQDVTIAGTPEQIARGEHLATVICAACHSAKGTAPLSGGANLSADTGMPLGDLYPPNLTPAGRIAGWSDGEILRAMREGVAQDGRLLMMPAVANLAHLSDEDAQAIVAYLRSQPATPSQIPPTQPSLLLAALVGAGVVDINFPVLTGPVSAPPKAATAAYGEYIVSYSDCRSCHGANLDGKVQPPAPPGPNLTAIVPNWSQQDFFTAMRTGVDVTGHQIRPPMPWKQVGMLDDVELAALYQYLHSLPKR